MHWQSDLQHSSSLADLIALQPNSLDDTGSHMNIYLLILSNVPAAPATTSQ